MWRALACGTMRDCSSSSSPCLCGFSFFVPLSRAFRRVASCCDNWTSCRQQRRQARPDSRPRPRTRQSDATKLRHRCDGGGSSRGSRAGLCRGTVADSPGGDATKAQRWREERRARSKHHLSHVLPCVPDKCSPQCRATQSDHAHRVPIGAEVQKRAFSSFRFLCFSDKDRVFLNTIHICLFAIANESVFALLFSVSLAFAVSEKGKERRSLHPQPLVARPRRVAL